MFVPAIVRYLAARTSECQPLVVDCPGVVPSAEGRSRWQAQCAGQVPYQQRTTQCRTYRPGHPVSPHSPSRWHDHPNYQVTLLPTQFHSVSTAANRMKQHIQLWLRRDACSDHSVCAALADSTCDRASHPPTHVERRARNPTGSAVQGYTLRTTVLSILSDRLKLYSARSISAQSGT